VPGRNEPCSCGSGRKYKHCCLPNRSLEESSRLRVRAAEGRVIPSLLQFIAERWGEPLIAHAWEDFWNYDDAPDDLMTTPEFEPMFIPWLVLGFVPDPHAEEGAPDWPTEPIGLTWLATADPEISEADRAYIETACRSPMSAFAIEQVNPGRSIDLKDVLTGRRFHVLEQSASQTLRPADLIFARVLTIDEVSLTLGVAPFVVPPRWHTHIIDWRDRMFGKRLMTRQDLADCDLEIRDLYFDITAELLNPTPPQLCNTDGDPIALTTLTYDLKTTANSAFERLLLLATLDGEVHEDEVTRDESGAVTSATFSWIKSGNRQHRHWENTILGTMRIETGRLVADVNSTRRANRLKREIAKRLGQSATLIETTVVDPSEALEARARGEAAVKTQVEPPAEPPEELQAIQADLLRQEWTAWLDTRVPALGNKTPRQAARTTSGRERLEALLAAFDRDAESGPPGTAAHLAAVRSTLALEKQSAQKRWLRILHS
jgi:hypothetical protein